MELSIYQKRLVYLCKVMNLPAEQTAVCLCVFETEEQQKRMLEIIESEIKKLKRRLYLKELTKILADEMIKIANSENSQKQI